MNSGRSESEISIIALLYAITSRIPLTFRGLSGYELAVHNDLVRRVLGTSIDHIVLDRKETSRASSFEYLGAD